MNYQSIHFEIIEITNGVFAAIATPEGGAFSNAGIVNLGNRTLVFDAMETPQAAADLKKAARYCTGQDPFYLVLSHKHHDHWGGCGVFEGVPEFITTPQISQSMGEQSQEILLAPQNAHKHYREWLIETEQKLEILENDDQRSSLSAQVQRIQFNLEALDGLNFIQPNTAFSKKLILSGDSRQVELVNAGAGHTECDVYLSLPEEKQIFLGDLGFFDCHPFMFDAFPADWRRILSGFLQQDIDFFIPGHGPVGTFEDIRIMIDYMDTLESIFNQYAADDFTEEEIDSIPVPESFQKWPISSDRFGVNLKRYYQLAKESS